MRSSYSKNEKRKEKQADKKEKPINNVRKELIDKAMAEVNNAAK